MLVIFPGRELLDWFSLSEIEPHSLISIFRMDGDTFVIVAHDVSVKIQLIRSILKQYPKNLQHLFHKKF